MRYVCIDEDMVTKLDNVSIKSDIKDILFFFKKVDQRLIKKVEKYCLYNNTIYLYSCFMY